jgi:hypothetical protein
VARQVSHLSVAGDAIQVSGEQHDTLGERRRALVNDRLDAGSKNRARSESQRVNGTGIRFKRAIDLSERIEWHPDGRG